MTSGRTRTRVGRWAVLAVGMIVAPVIGAACDDGATTASGPTGAGGAVEPPVDDAARESRTVYVPAYGAVRTQANHRVAFAVTLSVRNIDPEASVALTRVDYFDTPGHKIRSFLPKRRVLRPLETLEFFVPDSEQSGGSGANFLIAWDGPAKARPLLAESIMIGYTNGSFVTFTSRGIQLDAPPEAAAAPVAPPAPAPSQAAEGGSAEPVAPTAAPSGSPPPGSPPTGSPEHGF